MRRLLLLLTCSLSFGCTSTLETREPVELIRHINPDGMHSNPAFTQVIAVEGRHRTIYVGGQNAVDASGQIVGKGDLAAQARQVCHNLETALAAADARVEDVVKWTIYVVQGHSPMPAFGVFQEAWAGRGKPPTISVVTVAGLAHPDFLLEIDGIAVVRDE